MTHSSIRLSGVMELTLLGPDGQILSRHRNHNSVIPTGQAMILTALQGQTTTQRLEPFLGDERFNANDDAAIEQRGVIRLKGVEPTNIKQTGGRLSLSYRGVASREAKVVGGGVAIFYKRKGSNKIHNALYNFAKTRNAVEVQGEMPLMLNFTLSVG